MKLNILGEPEIKRKRTLPSPTSSMQNQISFKPITPNSYLRVRQEHGYFKSPTSTAEEETVKRKILEVKYNATKRKLNRRNLALETIKQKLEESEILSHEKLMRLQDHFPVLMKKLILNETKSANVAGPKGMRYDEEIKKFAVTLHYYSPKAYEFVRDYLTLPHPSTLTSWMQSANCNPGFNVEVLDRIAEAKENETRNMLSDVVLQVDEMSIHKDMCLDQNQHKFMGFVDHGAGELEGDEGLATSALVIMLEGLIGGWKVAIGYIFTDKVDGLEMQTYVSKAFELLEERKFNVLSLTSDGNTANVSMFEKGCLWDSS